MPIVGTELDDDTISVFTTKLAARTFGGTYNADIYFAKNGDISTEGEIAAAWLQAGGRTDADIRNAWRLRLLNTAQAYAALETVSDAYTDEAAWLAETADWGIILRGYEGRGMQDAGSNQITDSGLDGKMSGLRKRYEARLMAIANGTAPLTQSETAAGISRAIRYPVLPRSEYVLHDPRYGTPVPLGWRW